MAAHRHVAGTPTDVDAVVEISCVANDSLGFLIETVHRMPRERDVILEHPGERRKRSVLPRATRHTPVPALHLEPGHLAQVWVTGSLIGGDQGAPQDRAPGEIRDRVARGFVKQNHVIALGDRLTSEDDPHPTP